MVRRSNRTTKRTRRAFNIGRSRNQRGQGRSANPPADPPSYKPVKWQSLMVEFDLTSMSAGFGAFGQQELLSAFRTQTGQPTINVDFRCKKIDAWILQTSALDLSGVIYDLTDDQETTGITVQKTDVAGKNHWPKIRLPFPSKDRQVVISSDGRRDLAAFYFESASVVIRVRTHVLWRFTSRGTPASAVSVVSRVTTLQERVVIDLNNSIQEKKVDTESVLSASSRMSEKTFTGSSLDLEKVHFKYGIRTNRNGNALFATVDYVNHCGRCHKRVRGVAYDGFLQHTFPDYLSEEGCSKSKTLAKQKAISNLIATYSHKCVVDTKTSPKRKGRGRPTTRSQSWKDSDVSRSNCSWDSVTPSQSVSNVTVNQLNNKIDQLERLLKDALSSRSLNV